MTRERKESEVGQPKGSPPIHPLTGQKVSEVVAAPIGAATPLNPLSGYHSKAVVAATLSCKSSPPLLRVKRGCAAHGAGPIYSFLLNRMALGTGRGPALCALTSGKHLHRYTALCSPFFQGHHFAPLQTTANNNKASALRLDALQNDDFLKENHIYTG